uniref:Uncharacterized protein n=1 Tax=Cucumis sativus TaxID=3659 RepID=A0A0A0LCW8_CUCSA
MDRGIFNDGKHGGHSWERSTDQIPVPGCSRFIEGITGIVKGHSASIERESRINIARASAKSIISNFRLGFSEMTSDWLLHRQCRRSTAVSLLLLLLLIPPFLQLLTEDRSSRPKASSSGWLLRV